MAFARAVIAFEWRQDGAADARRLASSLASGLTAQAASYTDSHSGTAFAHVCPRTPAKAQRGWTPVRTPGGALVLFNGYLANRDAVAEALGLGPADDARLFGAAIERWEPPGCAAGAAHLRLIGEYCALVYHAEHGLRLSRSPIRAPPLYYAFDAQRIVVASVPRVLLACGVPAELDELKIADQLWAHSADEERGFYRGTRRVPQGATVEVRPDSARTVRYYDMLALPQVRLPRDEDYVERARELLAEGTRAALRGFRQPAVTLSAGLDSPQVAVAALAALGPERSLDSYTFVPEPGWDGVTEANMLGNERPLVEAFAAMHPRLRPHFIVPAPQGFDQRWRELFHFAGTASVGLTGYYPFHDVWAAARRDGCDVIVNSHWGNDGFSSQGEWAAVEFFLRGRWVQLYRALRDHPGDDRALLRRFVARVLVPLLPRRAWRALMRLWHPGEPFRLERFSPLRREYERTLDLAGRAAALRVEGDRYQPRSHGDAVRHHMLWNDQEAAEMRQGFEQIYGLAERDPTAYRPLVEFCLGLPTDQFVRDGTQRWLARRMAAGTMPEPQRLTGMTGHQRADWHLRLARRRTELRAELERLEANPAHAARFDLPRLKAALDAFPERTPTERATIDTLNTALPRALIAARFVDYVEGRNAP